MHKDFKHVLSMLETNSECASIARLQEVVKHVERTAYLGGLNRENVSKAIDAAEQLASLRGILHLGELKGATEIMEKAPQALGQTTPLSSPAQRKAGEIER